MNVLERFSLKGKIALVTGGAGPRYGASISEALAEAGATLISASRSLQRNQAVRSDFRNFDLLAGRGLALGAAGQEQQTQVAREQEEFSSHKFIVVEWPGGKRAW